VKYSVLGTQLNGVAVSVGALKPKDVITMGTTDLTFDGTFFFSSFPSR